MKHKYYETCPKWLDWREWRKFLDLIEHHKARATINRATAGQPASLRLSVTQPDPIQRRGGR